MGARFALEQFSEIFKVRDSKGDPYLLIGGQAVNYWAEQYLPEEPELRDMRPFTSGDIDFRDDRPDVSLIAKQIKGTPIFPEKVEMTALAGAIPINIGDLPSNIEVVRRVPGVTKKDAYDTAILAEWRGRTIRVMNPVFLAVCKLTLAFTVPQEERQDIHHLRILIPCIRGYLRDYLREIETGVLGPKGWLGSVNLMWQLATSARGKKAIRVHEIRWAFLPMKELVECQNAKIRGFRENQLQRWLTTDVGRAFKSE